MIASRLKGRRVAITLSVIQRALSAGKYVESNLYTGIIANRQQKMATELATDAGMQVVVADLFTIYKQADGTLPAIEEKHVLNDGTTDYEVLMVMSLDYAPGLHVYTRRLR